MMHIVPGTLVSCITSNGVCGGFLMIIACLGTIDNDCWIVSSNTQIVIDMKRECQITMAAFLVEWTRNGGTTEFFYAKDDNKR